MTERKRKEKEKKDEQKKAWESVAQLKEQQRIEVCKQFLQLLEIILVSFICCYLAVQSKLIKSQAFKQFCTELLVISRWSIILCHNYHSYLLSLIFS